MHNVLVGAVLCGGTGKLLAVLAPRLVTIRIHREEIKTALSFCWKGLGLIACVLLWMVVPPFLTGFLFQSVILNPLQLHHDETPRYALLPCWSFGLVLLKLWAKYVVS